MLKRLLGIFFTLAALATFVWVGMGRYTSWCFAGEEVAVENVTSVPVDTVSAEAAVSAETLPADSVSTETPAAAPVSTDAAPTETAPAVTATPADSLSSTAADTVR